MKSRPVPSLSLAAAILVAASCLSAAAGPRDAGGGEMRLAQFYDPEDGSFFDYGTDGDGSGGDNGRTETYIDEFGRRVTVDASGRIVGVEQPRRRDRRSGRGEDRAGLRDGGIGRERRQGPLDSPDPGDFVRDPVDPDDASAVGREPLPEPNDDEAFPQPGTDGAHPEADRSAGLPDIGGAVLPEAGAPIVYPNDTTVRESDPAPSVAGPKGKNASVEIAALQVLLDRAGISPGVIDGRLGSNVDKAVAAYEEKFGTRLDATNAKALAEELDATGGPAVVSYTITDKDAAGPYVASIPEDYAEKAMLPAMSYARPSEMLAERFHMDESYLLAINRGADLSRPGTIIKVMAVGENVGDPVARIIADKGREQVRAYDASGRLVAAYPSTIGSTDTPSPSGTVQISRIAFDPNYTYNPKINFTQGENKSILTIPPGPNGPVGSIWIALSKPTYGIHGTPEPSKIGKTNSHGCVRLANFDAQELARIVKPGVTVEFID